MSRSKTIQAVLDIAKTYSKYSDEQVKHLKQCVKEARKSGDLLMLGAAYACLAEACGDVDDYHGMLVNSIKAVTLLKDSDEYELIAKAYSFLGHAYLNQGNYQMSLVCDELAYDIVKRHRIKGATRITALNNISGSYHAMDEPRKSVKYLNECINLLKKNFNGEYTDMLMFSLNLAGCHKDLGELSRAKEILESLADLLDKVDYQPLVCDYYLRSAVVFYLLEDTDSAGRCMDSAFDCFPKNTYPLPLYDDLCEVSHLIIKNKDKARSKKTVEIMTVYAENNTGTLEQIFAARTIANYYRAFGEYKLASEMYAKYEELNERQMRELKEMQMKLHYATKNAEPEIRRLKRLLREKEESVSLEPMTGLLNRSALLRLSSEFLESAAKKKQKVGVIFLDIDYFKQCNDTYGHAKGDEIIKEVAAICRRQETSDIRFARYGGDEFFGLTRGLSDKEVCGVAQRICRSFRNADTGDVKNPDGGNLTLSVGVVNVPITEHTDSILEIANYADKALYHAKNSGKNAIYELVSGDSGKEKNTVFRKVDF